MVNGGGQFDLTDYGSYPFSKQGDRSRFSGSVFYAGKLYKHLGAYIEGSYRLDPDTDSDVGYLNKVDLRFANQVDVSGHHVDYGVSVNNDPGAQDLWNVNGIFGGYGPERDFLRQGVAGATLYAMINNLLYIEAGGYATLPNDVQKGIGRYDYRGYVQTKSATPYWRIALQHNWNGHYFSIGHSGIQVDQPESLDNYYTITSNIQFYTSSSRLVTNLAVDATYQYLANPDHIFEFNGRYVRSNTEINQNSCLVVGSRFNICGPNRRYESNSENFNVSAAYTWQQTLGLTVGYQRYAFNQFADSDQQGILTQLSYTPFGKQHSLASPWLNLRLNVGYYADVSSNKGGFRDWNGSYYSNPRTETFFLNGTLAF